MNAGRRQPGFHRRAGRRLALLVAAGAMLGLAQAAPRPSAKPPSAVAPVVAQPPAVPAATNATGEIERRVIGSIIFPERSAKPRESSAQKVLTPEVKTMTQRALQFVRASQQADGCWGDKQFPKSSGVTALACMAFLAEGSLPRMGNYGKELDNGVGYLLSCGKEDGMLVGKDTYEYGPMYDHAWSTFVLLQAYGNCPWYTDMKPKLSRAIQVLLRTQRKDGGWRYAATSLGAGDASVTASTLYTIRLARMSGFAVPEDAIVRAQRFIERCGAFTSPSDEGTFSYREGGERGSPSVTGAGLMALYTRGLFDHPYVKPSTARIAEVYQRAHVQEMTDGPQFPYFHFGCFYASQAMYMAGDDFWVPWFTKYAAALQARQAENGSWQDARGNTVYPTAISAMILQAPLGYMPQYLR
jgi:hypothetical protein